MTAQIFPDGQGPALAPRPASRDSGLLLYEPYYGLSEKPFSLSTDPRFLYKSASHTPVCNDLLAAIRRREGLIVLTGEIGTGKTTLCRSVLSQLDRKTFTTFVPDPFLTREDLLKMLLVEFGVMSVDDIVRGRMRDASRPELSYPLYEFLRSLEPLDAFAVLIIDEAQNLPLPLLEEIRILSDLEQGRKLLQVVLIGQPEFSGALRLPRMRQVEQRVSMHCELQPLTREGVYGYVAHRLGVAGATAERVHFTGHALDLIFEATGGVPRVINLLCDRTLQRGHLARTATIGIELVREAMGDVRLVPIADAALHVAPPPVREDAPAYVPMTHFAEERTDPRHSVSFVPIVPIAPVAPAIGVPVRRLEEARIDAPAAVPAPVVVTAPPLPIYTAPLAPAPMAASPMAAAPITAPPVDPAPVAPARSDGLHALLALPATATLPPRPDTRAVAPVQPRRARPVVTAGRGKPVATVSVGRLWALVALTLLGALTGVSLVIYWLWFVPAIEEGAAVPTTPPAVWHTGAPLAPVRPPAVEAAASAVPLPDPEPTAVPPPRTGWVVQVGAFQTRQRAAFLVSELGAKGVAVVDAAADSSADGRLHVVFAGPYSTPRDAASALEQIKALPGLEGSVVRPAEAIR